MDICHEKNVINKTQENQNPCKEETSYPYNIQVMGRKLNTLVEIGQNLTIIFATTCNY